MKNIERYWYDTEIDPPLRLRLLSIIFSFVSATRRLLYRLRLLYSHHPGVPVIVVGNITVGGSGKSPLIIWLAAHLRKAGYHPGIISRGYGGKAYSWPQQVRPDADPLAVGDEAIMIARQTRCPMVVGPGRVKAVRALRRYWPEVDVILSDDGMQHYALRRDIEICLIDGDRRLGNQRRLPAGPLREATSRLSSVDLIVCNGGTAQDGELQMQLSPQNLIAVNQADQQKILTDFKGQKVHAVAGIGNPERFFSTLEAMGIEVVRHPFPDHYPYREQDLHFEEELPVFMTEKDAVKCERFTQRPFWYLAVEPVFSADDQKRLLTGLKLDKLVGN